MTLLGILDPQPGDPQPSTSQYAMIGEFGGIGSFTPGKEWKPKSCGTYLHVPTGADEANTYIAMAAKIQSRVDHVSASVYTQTTGNPLNPQNGGRCPVMLFLLLVLLLLLLLLIVIIVLMLQT